MKLWEQFDRLVVFDTETTGFSPKKDKIIELGAVAAGPEVELGRMDALLSLPEGRTLPPYIVELTGITDAQLASEGVTGPKAAAEFRKLLEGAERPLLAAYNAQFDLNFLFHFLDSCGMTDLLRSCRFLDVLTVYRDRRGFFPKPLTGLESRPSTVTGPLTTPGPRSESWKPWPLNSTT